MRVSSLETFCTVKGTITDKDLREIPDQFNERYESKKKYLNQYLLQFQNDTNRTLSLFGSDDYNQKNLHMYSAIVHYEPPIVLSGTILEQEYKILKQCMPFKFLRRKSACQIKTPDLNKFTLWSCGHLNTSYAPQLTEPEYEVTLTQELHGGEFDHSGRRAYLEEHADKLIIPYRNDKDELVKMTERGEMSCDYIMFLKKYKGNIDHAAESEILSLYNRVAPYMSIENTEAGHYFSELLESLEENPHSSFTNTIRGHLDRSCNGTSEPSLYIRYLIPQKPVQNKQKTICLSSGL